MCVGLDVAYNTRPVVAPSTWLALPLLPTLELSGGSKVQDSLLAPKILALDESGTNRVQGRDGRRRCGTVLELPQSTLDFDPRTRWVLHEVLQLPQDG